MFKIYIQTKDSFAKGIDCNEFYFSNVEVEKTPDYLTILDENGALVFRCHVNEINKFARYN